MIPRGSETSVERRAVELVGIGIDERRHRRRRATPAGQFELTSPHAGSVTLDQYGQSGAVRPMPSEHLAEPEREDHLERQVLHEPGQLDQLASGIARPGSRPGRRGRRGSSVSDREPARRSGTGCRAAARAGWPGSHRSRRTSRGSASCRRRRPGRPSRGCRRGPARTGARRRCTARRSAPSTSASASSENVRTWRTRSATPAPRGCARNTAWSSAAASA